MAFVEIQSDTLTPTKLARAASISVPYAHQLLQPPGSTKRRSPSLPMALRIYGATGLKLGQLEGASEEEIVVLARVSERAA